MSKLQGAVKKIYHANKIPGDMDGILSGYLIKKRIEAARSYLEGRRHILEIGCGVFRWEGLLSPNVEYIGLDCEEAIIEHNRSQFSHQFFNVNVEKDDFSFCGSKFDLILMLAVIEHFKRPEIVLKKLKTMLNSQGTIVLTTPHAVGNHILNFGAKIRMFSRDKHTHYNLLDYRSIKDYVCSSGYKIIKYEKFLYGFNQLIILESVKKR